MSEPIILRQASTYMLIYQGFLPTKATLEATTPDLQDSMSTYNVPFLENLSLVTGKELPCQGSQGPWWVASGLLVMEKTKEHEKVQRTVAHTNHQKPFVLILTVLTELWRDWQDSKATILN